MPPGRPPTTEAEKKAAGTFYNHDKLAEQRSSQKKAEETARSALPVSEEDLTPPGYLQGPALQEWNRFIIPLMERGFISKTDWPAAVYYCVAAGQFHSFMEKANGRSAIKMGKRMVTLSSVMEQFRKAINELGFTPRTRKSVAMVIMKPGEKQPEVNDNWGKIMYLAKRGQTDELREFVGKA